MEIAQINETEKLKIWSKYYSTHDKERYPSL